MYIKKLKLIGLYVVTLWFHIQNNFSIQYKIKIINCMIFRMDKKKYIYLMNKKF